MTTSPESPNCSVVALVGAGASAPLGIPTMREFSDLFMRPSESRITSNEKAICKLLVQKLGVPEDLEELLLVIEQLAFARRGPMLRLAEICVSRQKNSSRRKEFRRKYADRVDDLWALRTKMLDFLARKCFQFDRETALALLSDLLKAFLAVGCPVFTANYDFALEFVAGELGIQVNDNFTRSGNRYF